MATNHGFYKFVGIGAGPSNLSLAAQAFETELYHDTDFLILEKKPQISWHPGMLLPQSRLDTHFAKDLVTLVNPRSRFTFMNFLFEQSRLNAFLNCCTSQPLRAEFDEYLKWVASILGRHIQTGCTVDRIEQCGDIFVVHFYQQDGSAGFCRTPNIVIGTGIQPKLTCGLRGDEPGLIHSSDFLLKIADVLKCGSSKKLLVVGSGQSAAEIVQYLLPISNVHVDVALSDFAFTSKEGTPFINECFNGTFVDRYYNFSSSMKKIFTERRKNMNLGVVDSSTITSAYRENYYYKYFHGKEINFMPFSRVEEVNTDEGGLRVRFHSLETDSSHVVVYDSVIMATGYDNSEADNLISDIADCRQSYQLLRDFSVSSPKIEAQCSLFLNGGVADTHGPASDVLSIIAHRSMDILHSIESRWPPRLSLGKA